MHPRCLSTSRVHFVATSKNSLTCRVIRNTFLVENICYFLAVTGVKMFEKPHGRTASFVLLICILTSSAIANDSASRHVKKKPSAKKKVSLIIKGAVWGPSPEVADAAAKRVEFGPDVQSYLKGSKYRLL